MIVRHLHIPIQSGSDTCFEENEKKVYNGILCRKISQV